MPREDAVFIPLCGLSKAIVIPAPDPEPRGPWGLANPSTAVPAPEPEPRGPWGLAPSQRPAPEPEPRGPWGLANDPSTVVPPPSRTTPAPSFRPPSRNPGVCNCSDSVCWYRSPWGSGGTLAPSPLAGEGGACPEPAEGMRGMPTLAARPCQRLIDSEHLPQPMSVVVDTNSTLHYYPSVIRSYRDRDTQAVAERRSVRSFPGHMWAAAVAHRRN